MAGRVNGSAVLRSAPALLVTPLARCGSASIRAGKVPFRPVRTSQNRSKTPMERVPGVFRTGRQVEQGELDGPWWDPALDVDTEEEF